MSAVPAPEELAQDAETERRSIEALSEFFSSVETHLLAIQADPLSTELRKDQRALLIAAFLLLLVSLGTVSIKQVGGFDTLGGKLEVNFTGASLLLGTIICFYLEIVFLTRGYTEYVAHGIRVASARAKLAAITAFLGKTTDAHKAIKPFDESREGIEAAFLHSFSTSSEGRRDRISRGMLEDDPVAANALYRQAAQKYRETHWEPYAKAQWLHHQLHLVSVTQRLRYAIESVFPVAFGLTALVVAARRLLGDG